MELILTIKNQNTIEIKLQEGRKVIDREFLTISHNLDTLLITAIDRMLDRNKIDRLSLKSLEICGKMKPGSVSSMILKTVKAGLAV